MNRELALGLYQTMVRIRTFEEAVSKWFYRGKIPGFVHLYIGEEAIAAGVCAELRKDDCIGSTHRGHGHVIAKGADTKRMMAELFGRATGYCKGKGGSMHVADFSQGILGTNGVLAGGVAMATGIGLGSKLTGTDRVAAAFIGDAAANQGVVWESMNLAGLWKLPVIFVIEDNGFGEYTPATELSSSLDYAGRAAAWGGVAASLVDGNDVVAVHEAAETAVRRARAGEGPSLINCRTYRWKAHNEGEEAVIGDWSYRSKEDLEEWKRRDPIPRFEAVALRAGALSQSDMENVRAEIEAEIEGAVEFAQQSPSPLPEEAFRGVFVEGRMESNA
jgi:pyruvate dehydrogenase E1 component alpha subunit